MMKISLTTEDMADLQSGHTINVETEDGVEVIISAEV